MPDGAALPGASDLEQAIQNCGREAIHQIGQIQPTGLLLAVDHDSLLICHVSENVSTWFPYTHDRLIGKPLSLLIGEPQAQSIRLLAGLSDWRNTAFTELRIERDGSHLTLDAQVSRSGGLWLIEIEQEARDPELYQRLLAPLPDAIWQPNPESNLPLFAKKVVDHVRNMTGYNRVMMYQFDSNWDGEVIAESKSDDMESYLGNRFPASDIPPQARELYTKNLVRLISDVDAVPIPIHPVLHPRTSQPLDMTYSALRSLSPVHLQYLRNMGVRATLTISLIQNGQLWGLIACHHSTPKHVPMRVREMNESLGKTISLKLHNMERNAQLEYQDHTRMMLEGLTRHVLKTNDIRTSFVQLQNGFLSLVDANGAVLKLNGSHTSIGMAPSSAQMRTIDDWLGSLENQDVIHTETLEQEVPSLGKEDAKTCGMLLTRLGRDGQDYIAWFRKENVETVKWAGQPDKMVIEQDGILKISPRKSFATWIETFRGQSVPWLQQDIDAARSLSMYLKEVIYFQALKRSEEQYRSLYESHMEDMRTARDLLDHIMNSEGLLNQKIRFFQRPAQQFSGDFIAATTDKNGDLRVMLADVTGHGLQAALPLLPIFRTFHTMAKKTLQTGMIVAEVNKTLLEMNMPGRFMAAAIVHLPKDHAYVEVWNGGIPNAFFIEANGQLHKFRSRHLPLGIVDAEQLEIDTEIIHPGPGILLMSTDGLTEAGNEANEPFGDARLEDILRSSAIDSILDDLLASLERHLGGITAHDDVSIVAASCMPA